MSNKKDLIIVESPTKAKTINRFLGKKFEVVASGGHIRDLPKSVLGVDVEKNYKPQYEPLPKAEENIKKLKNAYKKSNKVYLATDSDREGEAIAFHVAYLLTATAKSNSKNTLPTKADKLQRITFHEITEDAINQALEDPHKINMDLVHAQEARRVLDRLVGYKLSPLLWRKIQTGLSAGRVQSVALRLIVEKEREREKFKEQDYWTVTGHFIPKSEKHFPAELFSIDGKKLIERVRSKESVVDGKKYNFLITSQEYANEVKKNLEKEDYYVKSVGEKEKNRKAYPPFTTSLLQQACSNLAGFSASRTMRAAQKLYEKGLITYHRTDSFNLSNKFINSAKGFIQKEFGNEYYEEKHFKTKSKGAQEAHEGIRPTDLRRSSGDLSKLQRDERIIYELVYARSLASLMSPIKTMVTSIGINSKGDKYVFKVTGQRVLFKGWAAAYKFLKSLSYNPLSEDIILPQINSSSPIELKKVETFKKVTQPPARYTEASLIKTLEKHGIGRPSTYAPIISTLLYRGYIEKETKNLKPLDLGSVVTQLLEDHFAQIVDYDFTAKVEAELDDIAEGDRKWTSVVDDFYKPFNKKVESAEKNLDRKDYKILGDAPKNIKCPICESRMVIKLGRKGKFYSCVKFPDCAGLRNLDGETEADVEKKVRTKKFKQTYLNAPKTEDGRDYVLKKGRFGEFWAHPDYPKVKDARPLEYTKEVLVEKYGKPPKTEDGKEFVFRNGKFGPYWAHPEYPSVKETVRIRVDKSKGNIS